MPTKEDFITQIEADLSGTTEPERVLKERLKRVKAAEDDEAASKAYFDHLEEIRDGS